MQTLKQKLASRKFWLSIAAMLTSIGTAITGATDGDQKLIAIGTICIAISAGIYSATEAYIDAQAVTVNNDNESED